MIVTTFGELLEYLQGQEWKASMPVRIRVMDIYGGVGECLEPVEIVVKDEMVVFQ